MDDHILPTHSLPDDELIDAAHFNMQQHSLQEEMADLKQQCQENDKLRAMQNSLGIKKREYAFVEALSKAQIDSILLQKDNQIFANFQSSSPFIDELKARRQQFFGTFQDKIEQSVVDKVEQNRRVPDHKIKEKYLKNKQIYRKITSEEQNELHSQLNQKKKAVRLANQIDDYDKLRKDYHHHYKSFLRKQPTVEENRGALLQSLGQCKQYMAMLSDNTTLAQPRFWDESEMGQEQKDKVKAVFERKLEMMRRKVPVDLEEEALQDVTKEVDKYLLQKYNDAHRD